MSDGQWTPSHASSGSMTPGQTTGSLKTKISLKQGYVVQAPVAHFHTMKPELPPKNNLLGCTDLLSAYDLGSFYNRFCGNGQGEKLTEDLGSFLPQLYGKIHSSPQQELKSLSLRNLVHNPPITGKEINPLNKSSLDGFRLTPGAVDEKYRHLFEREKDEGPFARHTDLSTGRYKQSIDPLDVNIRTASAPDYDGPDRKRHKSDKKEKKKKKDKKKKDKDKDKRDKVDKHRKVENPSVEF